VERVGSPEEPPELSLLMGCHHDHEIRGVQIRTRERRRSMCRKI
jgi:hypothetical protein